MVTISSRIGANLRGPVAHRKKWALKETLFPCYCSTATAHRKKILFVQLIRKPAEADRERLSVRPPTRCFHILVNRTTPSPIFSCYSLFIFQRNFNAWVYCGYECGRAPRVSQNIWRAFTRHGTLTFSSMILISLASLYEKIAVLFRWFFAAGVMRL